MKHRRSPAISHKELIRTVGDWDIYHSSATAVSSIPQREERFKVRWKLKFAVVNKESSLELHEGQVINMSENGLGFIGILTKSSTSTGDWCLCLLYPPTANAPFIALGRAVWQEPINKVFAIGIELLEWQSEEELNLALQLAKKSRRS